MIKKVFAILLLSLTAAACDSNTTETTNATPSPAVQVAATPAPSPVLQASPAAAQWKAGDKVKITVNGAAVAATIVSIDEKAAKATVKVEGETKERTVDLATITKP